MTIANINNGDTGLEVRGILNEVIDATNSGGGGGGLLSARVAVSSAEILALNSNPVELILAPGAGKVIVVMSLMEKFAFGTVAYANAGNCPIQYSSALAEDYAIEGAHIDGDMDRISVSPTGGAALEGEGLYLLAADMDPTDGDGTLFYDILYRIIDLV